MNRKKHYIIVPCFKDLFYYYVYVCLHVCRYVGMGVPTEAREGIRSSKASTTSSREPPNMNAGH